MDDNWLKQDEEPLFDDILWSKPERKALRGKLLIVGGHVHGFDRAAMAYQSAVEAGTGEVKVALPDKLKPVVGKSLEDAVYVPSTSIGTLAKNSLGQLKSFADWADMVLLIQTGDNSETSLLVTNFISEISKPKVLADDVLADIKHDMPGALAPPVSAVLTMDGLQALFNGLKAERTIRHDMGLRPLVLALNNEEKLKHVNVAVIYESTVVSYANGKSVTTKRAKRPDLAALAGWSAVWWMWQPTKPLEALATAAFEF